MNDNRFAYQHPEKLTQFHIPKCKGPDPDPVSECASCSDSDGNDIWTFGTVTTNAGTYNDFCRTTPNNNVLRERICDGASLSYVDFDCSSIGGYCDSTTDVCSCAPGFYSAGLNKCVECEDDGDCSGTTPHCNTATNVCVECSVDDDCLDSNTDCRIPQFSGDSNADYTCCGLGWDYTSASGSCDVSPFGDNCSVHGELSSDGSDACKFPCYYYNGQPTSYGCYKEMVFYDGRGLVLGVI